MGVIWKLKYSHSGSKGTCLLREAGAPSPWEDNECANFCVRHRRKVAGLGAARCDPGPREPWDERGFQSPAAAMAPGRACARFVRI